MNGLVHYFEELEALQMLNQNQTDYAKKDYSDCSIVYTVDLHNRLVSIPENIGVQGDHASTTIYFAMDRYYDYVDLTTVYGIIQYFTPDKQSLIYPIEGFDVDTLADQNKIIFKWQVNHYIYNEGGTLPFMLKLYKIGNKQPLYILNNGEYKRIYKYNKDIKDYYKEDKTLIEITNEEQFIATKNPYAEYYLNFQPNKTKISSGLKSLGYVPFVYNQDALKNMAEDLDAIQTKVNSGTIKREVFWTKV